MQDSTKNVFLGFNNKLRCNLQFDVVGERGKGFYCFKTGPKSALKYVGKVPTYICR